MKRAILLSAAAGLGLISASPPQGPAMDGIRAASGYPPCSRTVRDRCIQLHERGVGSRANLAANSGPRQPAIAEGGPYEPATAYPPCSATLRDRCMQGPARHARGAVHYARAYSHRVRRAGERG